MDIEAALLGRIRLPERTADEERLAGSIRSLAATFDLEEKTALEPETFEVVRQMYAVVIEGYGRLPLVEGRRILDIACGSRTSRVPSGVTRPVKSRADGYTSLFEPWLCRILSSLGAYAVGIDSGDLESESFEHYNVDLGLPGALDFLSPRSFDAVHDNRLFGSPEFTARFSNRSEVMRIAREIAHQEDRALRVGGIVLHSDAHELTRRA